MLGEWANFWEADVMETGMSKEPCVERCQE